MKKEQCGNSIKTGSLKLLRKATRPDMMRYLSGTVVFSLSLPVCLALSLPCQVKLCIPLDVCVCECVWQFVYLFKLKCACSPCMRIKRKRSESVRQQLFCSHTRKTAFTSFRTHSHKTHQPPVILTLSPRY